MHFWGRLDNLALTPLRTANELSARTIAAELLERYFEKGEAFLDGLTGSFAVAISDPAREFVAIARDGMGNGFIAYLLDGERLVVSPDESAVLGEVGSGGRYSALRLAEFYCYEELSGPETFFAEVTALLPGEMLVFEAGRTHRRWLTRPRLDMRLERSRWEEYVEEFAHLLDSSVRRCVEGLDRVAVLMSGGLDSTSIAALAARHLSGGRTGPAVAAVSWRLRDTRSDESELIRESAQRIGIEIAWIDCDDAVPFSNLPEWPVHSATPEQTAYRWFHQRSYARAAALGHRVLLSGFGGDSLYNSPRRWAWDLLGAEGPGRTIDRLREIASEVGWRRTLRTEVLAPLLPRERGLRRTSPSYLTESARRRLASRSRWPAKLENARRPRQAERLLALLDAHGGNVERHYLEPFALEQRRPLRDFALVQFALSVPDHLLRQGTESRPVLRAAMAGLVPDSVRLRRGKASFYDVLDRGLATEKLHWTKQLLLDPAALWRGYIEESAVRSWIESSPTDNSGKMGYLHAIYGELWRRKRAGIPWPSADAVD